MHAYIRRDMERNKVRLGGDFLGWGYLPIQGSVSP